MAVRTGRPFSLRGGGRVKAPSAALTLSPCETWDGQRQGVGVGEAIPPSSCCESRKRKRKMATKPNRARTRARAGIKPRLGRRARWPRVGWLAAASPMVASRFRPRSFLNLLHKPSSPFPRLPEGSGTYLTRRGRYLRLGRKVCPLPPSSSLSDAPKRYAELSCSSETCNVILVTPA